MKFLVVFIGLFLTNTSVGDLTTVRELYRFAKDSKENTEKFLQYIEKTDYQNDLVLKAYYGCALTLKASFSEKRGDKISLFKQGKKIIETAIEADPNNIELRMIRLSVQSNAPKITRYYRNIEEDKNYLLSHIDKVNSPKLKEFIKGFMSSSEVFEK
ncbi:hypothetical protein [Aquimarina sp. SS2-1]|uniref:hypothetical protein n=1 Tax=Aquimarina besae TaxID=3342247 RepID=UPI00366DF87B